MVDNMRNKASGLQDWVNGESFEEDLQRDFPRAAAVFKQSGMDRRSFLKFMGASLVAAGLQGCVSATAPDEAIIPYVRLPEEITPGNPVFFASTMMLGGFATGVVIETHEGRPHRIAGNPLHPASLGGSDVMTQASILELYNPDRSVTLLNERVVSDEVAFRNDLRRVMLTFSNNGGEGLRILTETVTSPTLRRQMEQLLAQYPNAVWHQYEPAALDNVMAGAMMAFGEAVNPVYRFDNADVVLSLDADFLTSMPGHLRYARDFASLRQVRQGTQTMNRLYAVESTPSNTGTVADHRLALQAREIEVFARALAAEVGAGVDRPSVDLWDAAWFEAALADLQANAGSSLVVAGPTQPPAVHALAHAINAALGNVGNTVVYTPPLTADTGTQAESLNTLVEDMNAGAVTALVMLGGNPVYTAPADVDFEAAMDEVPFTLHLSLYYDETSVQSTWHIPQTHYIEEWSDGLAYDGTASVVQPPIGPLYETVYSAHQIVGLLADDERSAYELVRETWQEDYTGADFDGFWRQVLHNGFIPDSAPATLSPSIVGSLQGAIGPQPTRGDSLEIIFRTDPNLYDGRFGFNAWLQEMPHPLTKVTWDNVALMSPETAEELGVRNEQLVELTLNGNTMLAPVWTLAGHPDDSVTVYLGYGRGISAELDQALEFNAYDIRPAATPWFASGLEVASTERAYNLARIRGDVSSDEVEAVYAATFAEFQQNPNFVEDFETTKEGDLLPDYVYDDNAWGMTIDHTLCIGCNACIIACQSENSIPTVGKRSIEAGREMYWIRVDLYSSEAGGDITSFQPVPCMHCENAPCEQVCPVQATVHSSEGLNQMIYNRCVGTRYCSANCPYGVRRFNFEDYIEDDLILIELRNPDVSVRVEGVMEKCTYCVQRINEVRAEAKKVDRPIEDGEIVTACESACPTQAIVFGNINDPDAQVTQLKLQPHNYSLLGELNTQPRTTYLARIRNPNDALSGSEGA